ncbi:hypothetical protein P692DRAFT_20834952 [Suillus brevipes Sb2]|nr:hypothetical protein P692DRAFT_20834952 [Suillus brevipes Sb2]
MWAISYFSIESTGTNGSATFTKCGPSHGALLISHSGVRSSLRSLRSWPPSTEFSAQEAELYWKLR